jgi:hypothetical protein
MTDLQIEALRQFFDDNVSEDDAYTQMPADPRFGKVDHRVISSVYNDLRKKTIADYSTNLDKYWHSTVHCEKADKTIILSEHFVVVFHSSIEDEHFHHFTVLDLFNNVTKFVYFFKDLTLIILGAQLSRKVVHKLRI